MSKTDDKNEFTLTLILSPAGLPAYSTLDWLQALQNVSHSMSPRWASYDTAAKQLKVVFLYY
jgi:hypothetical protein